MADDHNHDIQFNLDANKVKVLSVDGYLIGSNANTVTFNFAQALPNGTEQNIVARVSMSPAQAKEFLANLNDHIGKFEV